MAVRTNKPLREYSSHVIPTGTDVVRAEVRPTAELEFNIHTVNVILRWNVGKYVISTGLHWIRFFLNFLFFLLLLFI